MALDYNEEFEAIKNEYLEADRCNDEHVKSEVRRRLHNLGLEVSERGELLEFRSIFSNEILCGINKLAYFDAKSHPRNTGSEKMPKCPHADLIMEYAKDCLGHEEPWRLWQKKMDGQWADVICHPQWAEGSEYRRKPRTVVINGIEVEAGASVAPLLESKYYFPDVHDPDLWGTDRWSGCPDDLARFSRGIIYSTTEDAAAMARAMLAFKKI